MNIFIAGICGTFMGGIARLAHHRGFNVAGCDANVYPPMSTLLAQLEIPLLSGFDPGHIADNIDQVIIGNALGRGNELVEHVLNQGIRYTSGPQWLHDHYLMGREVLAVAGTHGKTTTASLLAWLLTAADKQPGFLIGGRPGNFAYSACPGSGKSFVVEADEYDTAFFDKRSKFVHYRPTVALLNNLEFDHADIFHDLEQIKTQFHHLVRIIPGNGRIVLNRDDENLVDVLRRGCWSPVVEISLEQQNADWSAVATNADHTEFDLLQRGKTVARAASGCPGEHNMRNALMAIAAAHSVGVPLATACQALATYIPPERRLQLLATTDRTTLYEDFAHHPTAIRATLEAMKSRHPEARLIAVIEPRSNTMRLGSNNHLLAAALASADETHFYAPRPLPWQSQALNPANPVRWHSTAAALVDELVGGLALRPAENSVIICMSNGGFEQIPLRLKEHIQPSAVQ